jgi:hypothetical protein
LTMFFGIHTTNMLVGKSLPMAKHPWVRVGQGKHGEDIICIRGKGGDSPYSAG